MAMSGKEILIKSVAQALPTYNMGLFKMPAGFHDDYMKMIRQFFWGEDQEKRKVHWAAWDVLVKPQRYGRHGFSGLQTVQ
jgi:hypothetical protein